MHWSVQRCIDIERLCWWTCMLHFAALWNRNVSEQTQLSVFYKVKSRLQITFGRFSYFHAYNFAQMGDKQFTCESQYYTFEKLIIPLNTAEKSNTVILIEFCRWTDSGGISRIGTMAYRSLSGSSKWNVLCLSFIHHIFSFFESL